MEMALLTGQSMAPVSIGEELVFSADFDITSDISLFHLSTPNSTSPAERRQPKEQVYSLPNIN